MKGLSMPPFSSNERALDITLNGPFAIKFFFIERTFGISNTYIDVIIV